jgi:hypothetical protein
MMMVMAVMKVQHAHLSFRVAIKPFEVNPTAYQPDISRSTTASKVRKLAC